jgi:hypothetical protein
LIVLVVGASYVLDVARRSRLAWGGGLPDLAHAIGLTVLTLGVFVGLVLAGQWARRLRDREKRPWPIFWRVLMMGWLAGSLVEVAAALQIASSAFVAPGLGNAATMRLRLTPLMTGLGMVGLILAVTPLEPRPARPGPRPRLGSWPSVALAALVGVVFLALPHGYIPYLVLIAIEAVQNALSQAPLVARPGLFDRMATAGLEALPGLLGCLATAVWVDDDLRAAARDPIVARAPRSWWGMVARASTVALAVAGTAYVLLVSIPTLSPSLTEGLATMVDPSTVATIALGVATLAAGPGDPARPRIPLVYPDRPRRLGRDLPGVRSPARRLARPFRRPPAARAPG